MGVPSERAKNVLDLIVAGAAAVAFIKEIKGKKYFTFDGVSTDGQSADEAPDTDEESDAGVVDLRPTPQRITPTLPPPTHSSEVGRAQRRVYITHGKNRLFVEPVKKLLTFGELDAIVSVERPSVSQPVPDKIMAEMRSCGAAIIHVDAEQKLLDSETNEHFVLNPNVLLEIGAAMALYGRDLSSSCAMVSSFPPISRGSLRLDIPVTR